MAHSKPTQKKQITVTITYHESDISTDDLIENLEDRLHGLSCDYPIGYDFNVAEIPQDQTE